ncbi:L type [Durusdinium trenchii]|uniref:L type n=1 Tax=Durusdinium trenchii TaxID=1381693 RepID=A0ABP0SKL0_9DINO
MAVEETNVQFVSITPRPDPVVSPKASHSAWSQSPEPTPPSPQRSQPPSPAVRFTKMKSNISDKSENSIRDKHAPVCTTSFSRKSAFMAKPIVPSGRRNSLREGREQRSEERAKKKKLPNGFALDTAAASGRVGRGRRISQLPAEPPAEEQYSRWTRARLWLFPMVRHKYFNFLSAALILSNAFFMGSETAWITCSGDAEGIGWYITNVCFTQIFLVELLVRWFVEGRYFWVDLWNVFDASLVLFSLIDDFVLTFLVASDQSATVLLALRFARMLRFVRVLRLLRLFKGLWYLVEGIVASLSSLAWAWLLLIVMMYLPAIFVTQTFGRNDPPDATLTAAFGTLPRSMYTLFKVMTMETWADLARYTGTIINGAEIFFVLYIFCTSFAVMNCVVAVIVQNTCVHAKERQEDMRSVQEKNDANAMVKILEVFQTADVQQTGQISKKEFLKAMDIPSVMQLMHEVQIDVRQAALLFDVLDYNNSGTLDSEEFLEGIMLARGEARSREVIAAQCDLWKDEHDTIKTLEELEDEISEAIDDVNDFIDTFRSEIRVARGADAIDNQFQWLYSRPE